MTLPATCLRRLSLREKITSNQMSEIETIRSKRYAFQQPQSTSWRCVARAAWDSSPRLPLRVVPFRRSFSAFIFSLSAMLAAVQSDPTVAEDRGAIPYSQEQSGCIVGHPFWPGPIVGGHNRQPTIQEFQGRTRELLELKQTDAYRCAGSPVGDEAIARPSVIGGRRWE
jgi:hypothetical protein